MGLLDRTGTALHAPTGPIGVDKGQMTGALFPSFPLTFIDVGRRTSVRRVGANVQEVICPDLSLADFLH